MTIHEKLVAIQSDLKAPKSQTNAFGKYKYRSCEDILEAVKPLLKEHALVLTISDEIVEVGGRVYVRATAQLGVLGTEQSVHVSAYARESLDKKGMDEAQITGAASSYARKYALNGLFCIDDTKDSDATNKHDESPQEPKADDHILANIDKLCEETGSDKAKVYEFYKVKGTPTPKQADQMLAALKKKLNAQLDNLPFKPSK